MRAKERRICSRCNLPGLRVRHRATIATGRRKDLRSSDTTGAPGDAPAVAAESERPAHCCLKRDVAPHAAESLALAKPRAHAVLDGGGFPIAHGPPASEDQSRVTRLTNFRIQTSRGELRPGRLANKPPPQTSRVGRRGLPGAE